MSEGKKKVITNKIYIQSYRPSKNSSNNDGDDSNLMIDGSSFRIAADCSMQSDIKYANILILINISMKYENHLNERIFSSLNQVGISSGYITVHLYISDYDSENLNHFVVDVSLTLNKILDMYQEYNNVIIVGYDLSTWLAQQIVMRRPEVTHYVLLSPCVKKLDFSFSHPSLASGLIIHPEQDTINMVKYVQEYIDKLQKCKNEDVTIEYMPIKGADHFFRNADSLKNLEIVFAYYLRKNIKLI
ncbi:MAG: hypothetical protein AAFO15_02220 [Pseudomonadota bacterium]